VDVKFTLLFFLFIAVAAFIAKRVIGRTDQSPTIEEIMSEIVPIIADPAALHRKVVRDLRHRRIHGAGTITDIEPSQKTVIIRVRDRVAIEAAGAALERDIVFELRFIRPDEPDAAGVGQYVEFTGILIDITAGTAVPVLSVDPGEILYIGDVPPEAILPEDDDPLDTGARFR
jgi:hypothetical protein